MLKKVLLMFNLLFLCAHGYGEGLYEKLELEEKISPKVFNQAIKGLNKIMWEDLRYLVIIDYTKPSTEPRFSVID